MMTKIKSNWRVWWCFKKGETLPQGKEVLQGDLVGSLHQVCEPVARRSD